MDKGYEVQEETNQFFSMLHDLLSSGEPFDVTVPPAYRKSAIDAIGERWGLTSEHDVTTAAMNARGGERTYLWLVPGENYG